MTIDGNYLFLGLIALCGFLTWFSAYRKNPLLSVLAGLVWLIPALVMFLTPTSVFGITEDWKVLFAFVFVGMAFVPWLLSMDTSIKVEGQRRGKKMSWTEYGATPKDSGPSAYEIYKETLQNRRRAKRVLRGR